MQEQQRAEPEADQDPLGQVAKHDEQERDAEHHGIAARGPDEGRDLVFLRHVPGDDRQQSRQRRERDERGQRCCREHEQQQEDGVRHAGDGSARAGADIGRGAGDGAGDADAPEQRRGDVGDTLGHELAVRSVPAAGHAVGHHGREQALDPAQQGERQGRGQHLDHAARARGRAAAAPAARWGCRRTWCRWSPPAGRAPRRRARPVSRRSGTMARAGASGARPGLRPTVPAATAIAARLALGSAAANASIFGTIGPGSGAARVRPSSSLSWLARMMTAMPAVNPTVTG